MSELDFIKATWKSSWEVPAKLNPWKWAEKNISFSTRVSPLPGRYSSASTPYVRAVLEAAASPKTRHITMCWSAQSSKTTTALIIMYYCIANDPGNILFVRPSLQAAKSLSENKIMLVIDENKELAKHKTSDKDDYQKTMLKLKNMVIFIRGASANQLSAESCKVVILDECDKYEEYKEAKAEADLVSLAYERTKFYKNHLKVDCSTPTIPNGRIWQLFKEGSKSVYMVPCPECGAEFNFLMDYFKFDKENPKNSETTYMECPHCKGAVYEKSKHKMMSHGRWVAEEEEYDIDHMSYQLPEFYSPITRWGELADKFLKATAKAKLGDFGQLHNFINSSLAEPWDVTENASRDVQQLMDLQELRLEGFVPDHAFGLTIGVDVQDLYLEYTIRAWGEDMESWLIKHAKLDRYEDLYTVMTSQFPSVSGGKSYKITGGLIDSGGHLTAKTYDFCRKYPQLRLRPSKGMRTMNRPYEISKIDKKPDGSPMPGGVKLVKVNTTYYKDYLAGKLSLAIDEPGAFKLHAQVDADYLAHMTAEYRNDKGVWICPSHKKNESWDCEILALLTADMIGLKYAKTIKGAFVEVKDGETVDTPKEKTKPKPKRRLNLPNPYTDGIREH